MRFATLLALLSPLEAAISVQPVTATATQAIIRYAGMTSPATTCLVEISEQSNFSALVNDVNESLFSGSGHDSRAGSIGSATRSRVFVVGTRTSGLASDSKLYSRALQANTVHYGRINNDSACDSGGAVTFQFATINPPLGGTAPESPPFNTSGFGNYAWPTINWTDASKTYIDPMTGLLLKRVSSSNWNAQANYIDSVFARAFDLNAAWTNPANITSWPGVAGTLATYAGALSDPIFVVADLSALLSYGSLALSGWQPLTTIDDVQLKTYGDGDNATAANRNILVCLSAYDSGNTCDTPEITVTLPQGAAAVGPTIPPTFPQAAWTSWAAIPPYKGRDWGTVITTVTTSGTTITNAGITSGNSEKYFNRSWKAGGKVLVNGTEVYTIASVVNGTTITTTGATTTHASPVSFASLTSGIRIRKQTGTGTINLSVGYNIAYGNDFRMPLDGRRNLCSPNTVTVSVDAAGNAATARTARMCVVPQSNNLVCLFAFFADNGEARLLSNFNSQVGYNYHSPDWVQYDGNGPKITALGGGNTWDASIGTRFYSSIQTSASGGPHYTLLRADYTGDFRAYAPYPSTNNYRLSGFWPDDNITWNAVGGWGSQGTALDQQVATFGNSLFDASVWTVYALYGFTAEGKAIWGVGEQQDDPGFVVLQDPSTGNVTSVIDEISTYPLRFWGDHGLDVFAGKFTSTANILGNKGVGTGRYLGGPFMVTPTQVNKSGTWNSDTSLTAIYADACPNTIAAQWQALGATGNNCVQIRAKQPCSANAGAHELVKFPCPWDGTKSMMSALAVGDRFWVDIVCNGSCTTLAPGATSFAETMRVVTVPVDQGGGVTQFWALRHSEAYGNIGGAMDGSGNPGNSPVAHPNGWSAAMIPPEARTVGITWFNSDGTFFADTYTLGATHADVGPGYSGGSNLTSIGAGQTYFTYGIRWNKLLTAMAGQVTDYDLYANGRFSGKDNGGGSMESYVSMRQIKAPASEKRWFADLRHMSPFGGTGQEVYLSGVGTINANLVGGTTGVYQFTAYPGDHTDSKRFPALSYAGRYLLQDASSAATGNLITDSTPWKYCVAYKVGECRAGSTVGQGYLTIPQADTAGVAGNSCIGGWYASTNPCLWTPFAMDAWGIQVDASRPSLDENHWRKLTMGFSGPGRQYQFGNITVLPEGTWGLMQGFWLDGVRNEVLAIKIPPFPSYVTTNRADFVSVNVALPAGPGVTARVRFGYAENGAVTSYFCTSRQEACVTDTLTGPFAYVQSDTLTPASCASGCTIAIPGISGRVMYYRIERLDGGGAVVQTGGVSIAAIP